MIPENIILDLRSGLTLEETLQKHNTNLKSLFKNVNKYPSQRQTTGKEYPDEWKYIQPTRHNTYRIGRNINCHREEFGTYSTFTDAKLVRDELNRYGWTKKNLNLILKKHNIHRRTKGGYHGSS